MEVPEGMESEFESAVPDAVRIGRVGGKNIGISDYEHLLLEIPVEKAYGKWKDALSRIMG